MNWIDPTTWYEADAGTGGAPASDAPAAGGDAQTPTGGEKPGKGAASTAAQGPGQAMGEAEKIELSSAQLAERLERAKSAERAALLKSLGVETPDALKEQLEKGKAALQAQMTEAEKQAAALEEARKSLQALQQQTEQAQAQARQARLEAEALGLMAGRFANPKAALKLVDLSAVKQEDGSISGLKEAVDKLAAEEPWTLAQPGKKPVAPPIGATNPQEQAAKESDAERRGRYFGNLGQGGEFFKGGGVVVRTPNERRG